MALKPNAAYDIPERMNEEIYDEVDLPEYEKAHAKARQCSTQKRVITKKNSKMTTAFLVMAFVTGFALLVLLLIVLVLTSLQNAMLRESQVSCPGLSEFNQNGKLTITNTGNSFVENELGSVATYSCKSGYALVGDAARFCVLPGNDKTVAAAIWNGSTPACQIVCENINFIEDGEISTTPTSKGQLATYTCDSGYVLVGPSSRECVYTSGGEQGEWNRNLQPTCKIGILIDCNKANCRSTELRCLDHQGDCRISCNDTLQYTCHQASIQCPSNGGGCFVDCASDYRYACLSTNTTCTENGNCIVDCVGDYSCRYSNVMCPSNGNCIINCESTQSCSYAAYSCLEYGNLTLKCNDSQSCQQITMSCEQNSGCFIDCAGSSSCQSSTISRLDLINCNGPSSCDYATLSSVSHGHINCSGSSSCYRGNIECEGSGDCVTCSGDHSCWYATVTFSDYYEARLECSGRSSCYSIRINCPSYSTCSITCNTSSCQSATINCPDNSECNVNCIGQNGCNNARVVCPSNGYRCNIKCSDPLSCNGLRITDNGNVNLQCCGDIYCGRISAPVSSVTQCEHN